MKVPDKNKTIQVLFPCVHGLANGQLVTINCFPSAELKSTIKAVTGVDEEIAARVIGASRYGETDGRAGIGVMALFSNPLFSGESYGLALAVADKLARFDFERKWTEIYATGSIPADGCGRVEAVDGLLEKLNLLLEKAKPGSLFLYPAKNSVSSDQVQEKFDFLRGNGMTCIAVAVVGDLQGKLWKADRGNKHAHVLNRISAGVTIVPARAWQAILGVCLVGIAAFLIYFSLNMSTGNSAAKLSDQDTWEKKNNINEEKEIFSHQEIMQKERITDATSISPSDNLAPIQKDEGRVAGDPHQTVILESTDTDSSLY